MNYLNNRKALYALLNMELKLIEKIYRKWHFLTFLICGW